MKKIIRKSVLFHISQKKLEKTFIKLNKQHNISKLHLAVLQGITDWYNVQQLRFYTVNAKPIRARRKRVLITDFYLLENYILKYNPKLHENQILLSLKTLMNEGFISYKMTGITRRGGKRSKKYIIKIERKIKHRAIIRLRTSQFVKLLKNKI